MMDRDSKRLFVGNLPPGLQAHELQAVFAPLGSTGAELPNPGKAFGFVQFSDGAQATQAMTTMQGFELAGRPLRVSRPHNSRVIKGQNVAGMAQQQVQQNPSLQYQPAFAYGMQHAVQQRAAPQPGVPQQQQHAAYGAYGAPTAYPGMQQQHVNHGGPGAYAAMYGGMYGGAQQQRPPGQ